MGEVERLRSSVAKDAAAMQAVGVLVEAKALKLDLPGGLLNQSSVLAVLLASCCVACFSVLQCFGPFC